MKNLGRVLGQVRVYWSLVRRRPRLECARRDVILQQLLVYDVDDGGDQRSNVLRSGDEGFDIAYAVLAGYIQSGRKGSVIRELKSRKEWRYWIRLSRLV